MLRLFESDPFKMRSLDSRILRREKGAYAFCGPMLDYVCTCYGFTNGSLLYTRPAGGKEMASLHDD